MFFSYAEATIFREKWKKQSSIKSNARNILSNREIILQTTQDPVSWTQQKGCSQGSCTGPIFWNLVANEIPSEELPPDIHLQAFADDFVSVEVESTGAKLKSTTQEALSIFKRWTDKYHLQYQPKNPIIFKLES
ncbi:hypothetical protein AVEN_60018-1 [Araneus ventricosus]|uniref:Reverse transcriptase domain-containing protein n=1 Tax=Araneus ventricosus TaxID=182803 RepID=A0A4Y2CBJ8_ARAVE|nr:hypothetical protein AVEN_60018-1 [Araneus ventricosus]